MPIPGTDPDAPELRRAFEAAWEDPAFVRREPGWVARRLTELQDRIFEFVEGLIPDFDLSEGWAAALGQVMVWILAVSAVLVLAWAAWALLTRKGTGEGSGGASRPLAGATSTDPDEWTRRAAEAAGRGDWRRAALFRYRSVVCRLSAAGHLRPREGLTPGDHLRELARGAPELVTDHRALVRLLHPLAFGPGEPSRGGYEALEAEARRLEDRIAEEAVHA